jgi:hypothetical protein
MRGLGSWRNSSVARGAARKAHSQSALSRREAAENPSCQRSGSSCRIHFEGEMNARSVFRGIIPSTIKRMPSASPGSCQRPSSAKAPSSAPSKRTRHPDVRHGTPDGSKRWVKLKQRRGGGREYRTAFLPLNPGIDDICPFLQHMAALNLIFRLVVNSAG